jgi:hypothetical protein
VKSPVATPDRIDIYAAVTAHPDQKDTLLGDLWRAAEVADVRPETIRVWVSRGKITPVVTEGGPLFHLPTVKAAAAKGRKFKPADPAANSRGTHQRRLAA